MKKDLIINITNGVTNEVTSVFVPYDFDNNKLSDLISLYIENSVINRYPISINYSFKV